MTSWRDLVGFPHPVNEKAARVVAGCVAATGVLVLLTGWQWLSLVMAAGFALRVASGPRFSPFGLLATRIIAPHLGTPRLVAGPPKRFAQCIGLTFTLAVFVLGPVLGFGVAAAVVLGVLVVFALLESVLGFCAGCWVFGRLIRVGLIPESTCEACAAWRPARPAGWSG